MPISSSGQGFSDNTATKQEQFKYFATVHLNICQNGIFKRHQGKSWLSAKYHFIDLNAGTGINEEYGKGSPIIFLEKSQELNVDTSCFFVDIEQNIIDELKDNVAKISAKTSHSYFSIGNKKALEQISSIIQSNTSNKAVYGLVYSDENGNIPPFEELSKFFSQQHLSKIDVLIYFSATNIKRVLKSAEQENCKRLAEYICDLPKTHWQVRQLEDRHQWCFLFGTNWSNKSGKMGYPEIRKLGFRDIQSREGQKILEQASYTNDELDLKQKPFFPGFEDLL
ncbi:hypothetical protein Lepto7376_1188 [[Leptolyngbya] sp. PCC 7376]|uniref:three-Cys-motif partner protein TcmP n=1 Tax=[Leptolyngbya] sp. PCC 7376 TaxID=111781 RepID=UPI00029F020E|nr:three-Cys-motif partner protein TcmP [[Leptolyngbya] sp. PCC 7376]AFY37545.1 hypothetical protein Lepto7376_1188 [[Leptolyngbya] sp. PCC 7376]